MSRKTKRRIELIAIIAIFTAMLAAALFLDDSGSIVPEGGTSPTRELNEPAYLNIKYRGKEYSYNQQLTTVLFMGIDDLGAVESSNVYINNGQADFLMLAVINSADETYTLLQINRDTITPVKVLGLGGKTVGKEEMHLALAHTYGSGMEDSCRNTVEAVSDFLNGIGIDHYISMNLDGVGILNDAVGGVTVTALDNFENEPAFVKGEEITLDGRLALRYVQGRMDTSQGTNVSRMERQTQYIEAFLTKLNRKLDDSDFIVSAFTKVADYLVTDMSVDKLVDIANVIDKYEFVGVESIDGMTKVENEYMEFHPDEKALAKLIVSMFYVEK